jgi:hypothetical protein
MADQVRVFVSHHHSPEEDAFTARLAPDLEAAGARSRGRIALKLARLAPSHERSCGVC